MIVPHTGCLKQQEYIVKRYGDRSLKSEWCRGFFLEAMQEGSAPTLSLACGWLSSCSHGILPVYPVCVSGSKYPFSAGHQSYWIRTHPTVVIVTWFTSLKTPFTNKTTLGDPERLEIQYMNLGEGTIQSLTPPIYMWENWGPSQVVGDLILGLNDSEIMCYHHILFSHHELRISWRKREKKSSFIWIYLSWDKFDGY